VKPTVRQCIGLRLIKVWWMSLPGEPDDCCVGLSGASHSDPTPWASARLRCFFALGIEDAFALSPRHKKCRFLARTTGCRPRETTLEGRVARTRHLGFPRGGRCFLPWGSRTLSLSPRGLKCRFLAVTTGCRPRETVVEGRVTGTRRLWFPRGVDVFRLGDRGRFRSLPGA